MQITSVDMQSQRIHVKLKVQQEPMMDTVLRKYNKLQIHYLPINQMAKRLGMPILALTRITASLLCERGSPEKWGLYTHALIVYTVFLLKIRHLLFFGTLSLKCVLNLQISASALVLRHSKPTAWREKSFTSWKRAVDTFSFKTRARRHTSNYSALMELLPQLLPNIGQANLKLFILRRILEEIQ